LIFFVSARRRLSVPSAGLNDDIVKLGGDRRNGADLDRETLVLGLDFGTAPVILLDERLAGLIAGANLILVGCDE
jgi:hypothetical protein